MNRQYFVYVLASRKCGVLYIGITNDIARRVQEHRDEIIPGFTREYHVHHLVYYECFDDPNSAIQREKNIKTWKRSWKIELIENTNPQWKDLSDDLLL